MKKVLIATMGLDIGGAETHIIELSGELIRRGWSVVIASAGGVYVEQAEKMGARHYNVPLNSRHPAKMLESHKMLKSIIKREKPDVVHAHARIPGFICGILQKSMKFPFVTTCHGVYAVTKVLKFMSDWGQKTISVSDDIKNYLIENYSVSESDIITTVNGIDTAKFSPSPDSSRIRSDLGISEGVPVIVHVSRLDDETTHTTETIQRIMPELDRSYPGITAVIAGGGTKFEELCSLSAKANEAMCRNAIIMTGPRTDIADIISAGDVFVGVSRAALEAMASSKPVVLCGNEGFIGMFDEAKLSAAQSTNFCCRGCGMMSDESLIAEISAALNACENTDMLARITEFGRSLVISDYSISRMADDTISAYDAVMAKKWNVVMSGYFGFGNAGDEAILQTVHKNILSASSDVSITVLSRDPQDTRSRYGFNAIDRFDIIRVIRAIRRCSALVFGGGSLLQDHTSTRSLLYYLSIIKLAQLFGKKVMVYANGIGPVDKPANRRRVKNTLQKADLITLRDPFSLSELEKMGVKRSDIVVTADPVFTIALPDEGKTAVILDKCGIPTDKPFIGVSVRPTSDMGSFITDCAALCDKLKRDNNVNIVFIAMQSPVDTRICEEVRSAMAEDAYVAGAGCTSEELLAIIGSADVIIGMRLHTLIFSARCAVPAAGIVYDPKVSAYLELLELPAAGTSANLDCEAAYATVCSLLDNHGAVSEMLKEKTSGFAEKAMQDAKMLIELLEK